MFQKIKDAEYFAHPALSASKLKVFINKSPAHYHDQFILGNQSEPSKSMNLGKAVHAAILEPELFNENYVVAPDFGDQRKAENKAAKIAFNEKYHGKEIITDDDMIKIEAIVNQIKKNKFINDAINGSITEQAIFFKTWLSEFDVIDCKAKFDAINLDQNIIIDIKTTQDASAKSFKYDCYKYGYDLQAAFYMNAYMAATNKTPDFYFVAIETSAPYALGIYRVSYQGLNAAFERIQLGIKSWYDCKTRNEWPDYSTSIVDLSF